MIAESLGKDIYSPKQIYVGNNSSSHGVRQHSTNEQVICDLSQPMIVFNEIKEHHTTNKTAANNYHKDK